VYSGERAGKKKEEGVSARNDWEGESERKKKQQRSKRETRRRAIIGNRRRRAFNKTEKNLEKGPEKEKKT